MSESWAVWIVSLLGAIAVLALAGVWIGIRLLGRLRRIERLLEGRPSPVEVGSEVAGEPAFQAESAFGRFLDEHPECKELSKSEQFAAYRNWRKQQGLNWVSR